MFRTSIKIISTVLAAAAVAVPVASAGSNPTTPRVGQGFSLGVPLEYLATGAPTHATQGFSLGVPLEYLSKPAPTHATEGFSLGVPSEYLAQPTSTAGGNGFDWADAGIGGGIVAGMFLVLLGVIAAIRTRPLTGRFSQT